MINNIRIIFINCLDITFVFNYGVSLKRSIHETVDSPHKKSKFDENDVVTPKNNVMKK
jgi:hypothetical protein